MKQLASACSKQKDQPNVSWTLPFLYLRPPSSLRGKPLCICLAGCKTAQDTCQNSGDVAAGCRSCCKLRENQQALIEHPKPLTVSAFEPCTATPAVYPIVACGWKLLSKESAALPQKKLCVRRAWICVEDFQQEAAVTP